ncbi:MAG: formate dehydrogenase accessory sulfurtransferase FdhD [Verrucomicrobiales bacterium]
MPRPASQEFAITRLSGGDPPSPVRDAVAAEEPLEIRVEGRSVAVVMRTPGHDRELAAGFLLSEGVIRSAGDVFEISECPAAEGAARGNVVDVFLRQPDPAALEKLTRHVFSASSCGICGKATIDSVFAHFPPVDPEPEPDRGVILSLPGKLREAQAAFDQTGGLHASGLFSRGGDLLCLREDVGRHNALDKVIGRALLDGDLPLSGRLLLVSGRVSFEIMQKALAARLPVVAAISAPSSLAVEFARGSGQRLIGFLRGDRMNVYSP